MVFVLSHMDGIPHLVWPLTFTLHLQAETPTYVEYLTGSPFIDQVAVGGRTFGPVVHD